MLSRTILRMVCVSTHPTASVFNPWATHQTCHMGKHFNVSIQLNSEMGKYNMGFEPVTRRHITATHNF